MSGVVTFQSDPAEVWALHGDVSGVRAYDIGANGGITANLYAKNFVEVHAFEPATESYSHLMKNRARNVTPHQWAISDVDAPIDLDVRDVTARYGELTTGDSLEPCWGKDISRRSVQAHTLDWCGSWYGQPDYIKIDTEGHETRVVLGGDAIFEARPALFIEIHAAANVGPIVEHLQPWYPRFTLHTHPGYARGDRLAGEHFFLTAGIA